MCGDRGDRLRLPHNLTVAVQRTKPRRVTRHLGDVRLWRDDLAEILKVIQQVHPVSTLEVDAYTCESVEDLASLEEARISRFVAQSDDHTVVLVFDRKISEISAVEPDLATRGMLSEVEKIAGRGFERRIYAALTLAFLALISALIVVAWLFGEKLPKEMPRMMGIPLIGVMLVFAFLVLVVQQRFRRPILYTRTRAEAPTWLHRNRDSLITNAIVSAVFLVIGILIGNAS